MSKQILIITYIGIWVLSIIVFWCFMDDSDALSYSIIFLWLLIPATTFFISLSIGKNDYWAHLKWLAPIIFGIMYMLLEFATFSTANMIAFNKFNMPEFEMVIIGAVISIIGLAIGSFINRNTKK